MFEISKFNLVSLFVNNKGKKPVGTVKTHQLIMAWRVTKYAPFWRVVCKRHENVCVFEGGGGCGRFGHSKIQNFTRAFHFDPSYGFTGSICGSIYAPNWYQNSPISMRLNLPIEQHHSGLTHCDAFLGIKWLLLYISRGSNYPPAMMSKPLSCREKMSAFYSAPVTKFWANVVSIGSLILQ